MRTYQKLSSFLGAVIILAAPFTLILDAEEDSAVFNRRILIIDEGLEYEINPVRCLLSNGVNSDFRDVRDLEMTIGGFLEKIGIEIKDKDIVFPDKELVLQPNTKIIIKRAVPVILDLYGSRKDVLTQKNKISELLVDEQIQLKENDLINVNLDAPIFPGLEIKIWEKPKTKPEPEVVRTGRIQEGTASWYAFRPGNFAASTTFKKGARLLVTSIENGRQVVVLVNDYGPSNSKIIDLEKNAFAKLAPLKKGVIKVKVEELK